MEKKLLYFYLIRKLKHEQILLIKKINKNLNIFRRKLQMRSKTITP